MDREIQPNFDELSQSFKNVAHQVSLIPNPNFVHHGQQLTRHLEEIGVQMRNVNTQQTRILEELVELRNITNSINVRMDAK